MRKTRIYQPDKVTYTKEKDFDEGEVRIYQPVKVLFIDVKDFHEGDIKNF